MAELYENPKQYLTAGGSAGGTPTGEPSFEDMLSSLPPEEREEAMQYITAPPSGEEIMRAMQEKNSKGEVMNMTLDQYRLFKAHNKTKEVDVISGIGEAAGVVFDEIQKAAGSIVDNPVDAAKKLTPSVIEAFAQGTRNLYGMAAQSADPNSVFFRMKNALQANGDDEEAELQQFMEAQAFNVHSMRLMTGQDTIIMDKDVINPEMTQVMSYIADPTLFVPFGGLAAKGATMIGMGEKLAMAGARTQAIRNMVLGGAIKWGVGAPLEFMGGAIRNTIDYGIETGSRAIETATGVAAKDIQSAARVGALGTTAGSALGLEVNSSVSAASRYYTGSLIARNVGEAASIYGEQMMKQGKTGRGVLGYAGQAIRDTERDGIKLTPQTKSLLKAIEAVDPLFVYADDIAQGAAQGAIIGGGLGYLAGGEEGFAGGVGSGMALGAIGATAGKVVADVTGNTKIDQMAIQRKLIIEALKENGNENAIGFEAMAAMAEATGDRAFQGYIDGIIAGIDTVNPDAVFKAYNEVEYNMHLKSKGIDPNTGVLLEKSRIFPELVDRTVKADVLGILRDTGNRFAGDPAGFEQAIKNAPEFAKLKPVWSRLDDNAKAVILKQIKDNGDPAFVKGLRGRQLNAHWGDLAYSERLVDMINTLNQKNSNSVPDKIREILKQETRRDKKLTRRGQMLKEKLQADGYIDKDGNIRQRRLADVEGTQGEFEASAGWAKTRDSTGRTEVVINLDKWAKDSGNRLSLAHELYHSIMLESVFAPDYIDRLSQKLLGKFDPKTGRVLEQALVAPDELMKFFSKYIENDPNNRGDAETIKRKKEELKKSIEEYRTRGTANRVADATAKPLEHLVEEFGAYYFSKWVKAQPIDYMFRGGEFGGIRGLMEMASDGWLDYWKGKVGEKNPNFNFDAMGERGVSKAFERDGKRVSSRSLDLFMRDIVRIEANRNSNNGFDVNKLSKESREWFLKVNGLRGAAFGQLDQQGNVRKPKLRRYTAEEIRQGKEMFKVLESLPDAAHKDGMRRDGDGNWSGMPNTAQINALVGAGYIQRAWFDRMMRAYDIVNGNGSNVVEFGYLGYSAHIGDGNERVYGAAVPFKNRRAVLIGVDFKVRADGTVFSNLHTLDLKVIEARGNEVWKDPQTRELWKGSRTDMEADFYAYLSNASLPSDHPNRKPSARLLDKGDGLGGQRRDALHQMLGFHKGSDLPYINRPIAEIPVGIRHSVTTFSNDGIVNMRVDNKPRYDFNFENAHLDLSRNFMPDEMTQETTPSGGKIIKHATGYQISKQAGTKFKVFDPEGKHLGDFDTIADAGRAAQKHFNMAHEAKTEGKDPAVPRTEVPPSRQAYVERNASNELWKSFEGEKKSELIAELDNWITYQGKWEKEGVWYSEGDRNHINNTKIIEKVKRALEENDTNVPENLAHAMEVAVGRGRQRLFEKVLNEARTKLGAEYDAMYPMEIKSALHGQLAQIFQDHPNITAQGLLKKLVTYGSRGSRFFQEATEIGLVDMLKAKIQRTTSPMRMEDGRIIQMPRGGETQPKLDMAEVLDFAKSKEIRVTIEEGAREVNGMNTESFTLGGAKDNYKQTAIRINPEYAHGIRGHYGEDTIVHFRTTERIDADGNRHLFIEEVQANNTDKKSGQTEADIRKLKRDEASLPVLERIFQEGKNRGLFTKYDNLGYEQNGHQSSVRVFFQSIEQKQQDGDLRRIFLENRETLKRFLGDSDIDTAGLVIESHFYRAVDDHYRHMLNNADLIKKWERENIAFQGFDSKKKFVEQNKILIEEAKERILNSEKEVKDSFENVILGDRTPPKNSKIPAMTDAILSIPELKEYFNAAKELAVKVSDFEEFLINSRTNEVAGLETYAMNPHHLEATISDIKTRIQQSKAVVKPLPLTSAKDWTLTALKGIIRQAIRDGLDKITLTHPDDSPTTSHMAGDSRKSLYGKLIPEVWGSWLKKYGIEIKQSNSMADSTLAQAKNRVAEVSNKIHDANKKVLERFEQVGSGENPEVINALANILATPVHQYDGELMNHTRLAGKINDVQLQDGIREVLLLKQTELNNYNDVLRLQEETVAKQNGVSSTGQSSNSAVNARISAEAIDRGMTFELNDRIKREFLEGRINTHSMPAEDIYSGGRVYDQNSKQFKSGFVGLYAAENPDRVKGISLQFMNRADGSHRIRLTDNSKKGESADIGHITANIEGDRATLSSHINEAYRGKKLAYVVYSEMAERLRAMGVTAVDGQIVNPDGIPIKVRERIIGDTRDLYSGRRINYVEGANRIRDKQELMGKMAGVDVTNTLYKQGRYMPSENIPPSRDQGFNRVYREISRSKKASARSIKQTYLDKWGIDLNDYERYKQLEDAVLDLEFRKNNNEYEGTEREYYDERQELLNEYNELESNLTDQITNTQGDYAHRFNDQEGEITSGLKSIDSLVDDISRVSLDDVDRFSGTNRLDALLRRRLGSGFAQEITGDNVFIADAFREFAGQKYEKEMIGKAFESELYSSEYDRMDYKPTNNEAYNKPVKVFKNKRGILVDILRSENKLTKEGNPQGEVNPRRIINALRNKSGGDSKVYAEAKAIGLIDWLESKQEGKNQKKVTTKELIEFVEENEMGLAIDPQLEQAADFGNTRPYVTGGEEQAKKGYRVYVVRMMNPKHQHGVEGHFGGAVVHVRVTLRDTKDGKKVMHIEEIQANNTATGVLSDAQRKIVTAEVGLFEQLKRKKEKILDERHDNQMSVDSDDTLTSAEKLDTKLQMRERSRKEIDALHAEYAEKIFQANREEWKDIYAHQPQRDDAGYIKLIKSSLEARGVDIFISERETKLNAKKSNAPLQDPKEWVKVAFRTVLRKALVEGVDRITITPWSETPLQVGMKAKSAERFYGKTIVDAFNSELQKMNSRLNVENKNVSERQKRITEANVKLNESLQAVANSVDVNAPNGGADIRKMFEYLHMSDEDLKAKMEKTEHEPYGQPYYGARPAYLKWAEFELQKLPLDYKGRHELYAATQRRANKLGAFIGDELASAGEKNPSGLPFAASEAHMSMSQYLVDRSMGFDLTPEMKKKAAKPQRMFQPAEGDDYRGTHKAPSGENGEGSLDAMDKTYPEDLYSAQGARFYGDGQPKLDKQMHDIIMRLRGKPDAMVTVYRAVPKGVSASINKGDWVTPLKAYAFMHGERWNEGADILEKKVKASELFTEGNSIYEFGWSPKEPTKADALRKEIADHEKFMERSRNKAPILWERKGTKIYGQREAMERRLSSLKYELKNIEQESNKPKLQPSEYTEFKSEQSPTGRILRNAKGYVIMMSGNKFRVYNPTKAIIGVYGSEEEAKKRIYREIPKQ